MAEIIMGIDHGNGNMKGVHVNFPCGLVRYTSKPGRFMNEDILEYNGVYYQKQGCHSKQIRQWMKITLY